MANSSADPRLFEAAQNRFVPYALLKDAAIQSGRSAPNLLDELSYVVASRCSADEIDFEVADAVMNAVWAVCVPEEFWADHDRTIPHVTNTVYLAFDAGGYYRETNPPVLIQRSSTQGRCLTRSLLSTSQRDRACRQSPASPSQRCDDRFGS